MAGRAQEAGTGAAGEVLEPGVSLGAPECSQSPGTAAASLDSPRVRLRDSEAWDRPRRARAHGLGCLWSPQWQGLLAGTALLGIPAAELPAFAGL